MIDRRLRAWVTGIVAVTAAASVACAQNVPSYDFQWATIGEVGNPAYVGGPSGSPTLGHGSVGYQYRISKLEVTTQQWMQYVNTFSTQSDSLRDFASPTFWGATADPNYKGPGTRYMLRDDLSQADLVPVAGINWREAAKYCNWLNNGKSGELASTTYGAYDTSTFTQNADGSFNDQPTHAPDAKFWIPSLDEWMKAAYFDPERYHAGDSPWLEYPQGSSDVPIPGAPWDEDATTSAGYNDGQLGELYFPLTSYADSTSPWGLWDLSGGDAEWLEGWSDPVYRFTRLEKGSWAGCSYTTMFYEDVVWGVNNQDPRSIGFFTLRIAGAVPAPSTIALLTPLAVIFGCKRKRGTT